MSGSSLTGGQPQPPLLRVVRGEPTAEELAALVAVVSARGAGADASPPTPRSAWNAPYRLVRRPVQQGPDGWRRSALPG
jgi:acyl-CoA carboxylase epsilon subunit